jgi:hypothetical protein
MDEAQEAREREAFEAHQRAQMRKHWLYDNPNGHRMVDHMLTVIPAEINGHKQNRAGEYVTQWIETKWHGWLERATSGVALPADPCPHCERGGTCDTAFCGRKRSSELMRLYGTAGVAPCEGPSTTAYAKQCRFYDVTVRGRRCEVTDHPDGRRAYFAWHEGADKLREVPPREAALRAEIDAAVAATYGVTDGQGETFS